MGQRFCTVMQAGRFRRFADDAFGQQIGGTVRVAVGEQDSAEGVLVSAEVRDDGREVLLTIEVPDGVIPGAPLSGFSLKS